MSVTVVPRCSRENLSAYLDQHVLIIGKLDRDDDGDCVFQLHDGNVNVNAKTVNTGFILGEMYQILGKVLTDEALVAEVVTPLGTTEEMDPAFATRYLSLHQNPHGSMFTPIENTKENEIIQ